LIDQSVDRWTNLKASIKQMQMNAPDGVFYKVLFLGMSPHHPHLSSADIQDDTVKDGTTTLPINMELK
jgi:hypothetical protein